MDLMEYLIASKLGGEGGGGSGTTVIANPTGEATDDLEKLQVGSTIYDLGNIEDVYVNGVSVVDGNDIAQVKSYKEVTQAQYNALPSSKLTDGIMYVIKDAVVPPITDEKVKQVNDSSSDTDYRVLLSNSNTDNTETNLIHKNGNLTYNSYSNKLKVHGTNEGDGVSINSHTVESKWGSFTGKLDNGIISTSLSNDEKQVMAGLQSMGESPRVYTSETLFDETTHQQTSYKSAALTPDDVQLYGEGNTWDGIHNSIKESLGKWLTGTLTAGQTTLTIQDAAITTDSIFDYYTSIFGVNPTDAVVTTGQIVLTFEAQQSNMTVKVKVI